MTHESSLFSNAPIERDRDQFLRELLRELSGVLEESVGLDAAEGFIARVGGRIGDMMDKEYLQIAGTTSLTAEQIGDALVDLKRRIGGGFSIESLDEDKIVLVNTNCPFGEYVEGRESLCMMTSNVFGRIAANNIEYARVELVETIARGDDGCRVVINFSEGAEGREYFG